MGNRSNEGLKALFNRASQLHAAGALDEAERLYRKLIRADGDQFHVLRLLGHLELQRGRFEEACKVFGRALRIEPQSVEVLVNRGNALMELGQPAMALEDYNRALARAGANERLITNRGSALAALRQSDEALDAFTRAIAMNPGAAQPYFNRGNVFLDIGRFDEALQDFDLAIERAPDYAHAHHNRGIALRARDRTDEAFAAFDRALTLRPNFVDALNSRRILFQELKRYEEAASALAALLEISPDFPFARGSLLETRLYCCDWSGFDVQLNRIEVGLRQNKPVSMPFTLLAVSDIPSQQLTGARIFAQAETRELRPTPLEFQTNPERLRIAYISADFREHPVATLLADVLEAHDRERIETIGVSLGPDDGGPMRRRLTAAFDEFLDMRNVPTDQIVAALRQRRVDVAIDLMGFTAGQRVGIFAQRVAPVQVNYLGFAGTVGSSCHDFILADRYLVPETSKADYSEQVAYLPDCYLAISRRSIAPTRPTREQAGLPATGVVFCAFNNQFKIGPSVFDAWMRILLEVPGSVLWLTKGNAASCANLAREAIHRGVDASRIVFAPYVPDHADHMARLSLADLFLDTYPYNAHATATDALIAGVPLITRSGPTFASRVAGSLVHAVGCPELIVDTRDNYERLAVKLALDEEGLHNVKEKLRANVATSALFDPVRYCRGLEATLLEMRQQNGARRPS